MAAAVAVPAGLLAWGVRRAGRRGKYHARHRRYEAALAEHADQEHQAMMRGDIEAGVFGAFPPPQLNRNDLPDADHLRQRAWQPDLGGSAPRV